jgi:pentatricopeptide repeat protein
MYTPLTRVLLFLFMLALAAEARMRDRWWLAIACLAAGALLVVGYYRNGTVWLAWRAMKKQRFDRARRLLATIRSPERLSAYQRACYEYLSGILPALGGGTSDAPEAAIAHLRRARDGWRGLPNNRCLATLVLVEYLVRAGDLREARSLLEEARQTDHRPDVGAILATAEKLVQAAEEKAGSGT